MANVADKVKQIRQAIYGRDVRESIASGIEAINAEVENNTSRQNVIDTNEDERKRNETGRIQNENNRRAAEDTRIQNEIDRQKKFNDSQALMQTQHDQHQKDMQTTFQKNEATRQADHSTRQQKMQQNHDENQKTMQDTFASNENTRQNTFDSREAEREKWYNEFRKWYNEQAVKGRLPVNLDGGYFGEASSTDKIYDGNNFGE